MTILDYDAYFFDLDGVIIDSEAIYYQIWRDACAHFYFDLSKVVYDKELRGKTDLECCAWIASKVKDFNLNNFKNLVQGSGNIFNKVRLIPGFYDFVKFLSNKPLFIVTSTFKKDLNSKIAHIDVSFFSEIITGDAVLNSKPDPDIYLFAKNKISNKQAKIVVFEDSVNGLIAAKKAALDVIIINNSEICHQTSYFDFQDLILKNNLA